ncbi:MAG TPA: aminotransferase class III-fold pyridoxal phosphate-dependent enzyme [Holophagaceae bacterium]|jgi:acetylornithine/N-succinyldiaminopimelate aminotransferase|nr:aminotransferase class III-fold pyridoxal phosphate-dependent enzyme [Holophagaceae bacterium]
MNPVPALLPTYAPFPFLLARGENDRVFDDHGGAWLDFYGGHCVSGTGHGHPVVVEAITAQAKALAFYSGAGDLAIRREAATRLTAFAELDSVFFCNSGAEANEHALKVALQLTGRKKLLAFDGAFHGRTLLALSATDEPALKAPLEGLLAPVARLPFGDAVALDAADLSDIAAVIVEPIQSMAGVKTAEAGWFRSLRSKCDASGALLIFDEVQTGMGRLGTPFAAQTLGVKPDLLTSAKALASGVPMGAVLMTADIARALKPGDLGSTFGGGPLACAALLATLKVISDEALMARALEAESLLRNQLQGTAVRAVRGKGLLLGLETADAAALKSHLFQRHILTGGSKDPSVLRLMPPLTITDASLTALVEAVHAYRTEAA